MPAAVAGAAPLAAFALATERDPGLASAWANHGTALLNLGRAAEARPLFERAFALMPGLKAHFPEAGALAASPPPVHHLLLEVRDLDRSLAFYRDRLGFTVTRRTRDFAMLETGSVGVYLWEDRWAWSPKPPLAGREPGGMYPHLTLPDVRGTVTNLRAAGDRIVADPRDFAHGTEAFVADPDGFVWALLSPPPPR